MAKLSLADVPKGSWMYKFILERNGHEALLVEPQDADRRFAVGPEFEFDEL